MELRRLLRISRPRFWIYELGPYLVGLALAGYFANGWLFTWSPVVFFFFFLFPANLFIYGINDIYDYETDKLNPKKVAYESLVMPSEHPKLFFWIAFGTLPFVLYGLATLAVGALCSLLLFFFFAGFYSAPPIRAKARSFWDSFFSAGHYVATGAFAFFLASPSFEGLSWAFVSVLLAAICWAMAMHAYSAIPDIAADSEAGLRTVATALGDEKTLFLCGALYCLAASLMYPFLGTGVLLLGAVYLLVMALSWGKTGAQFFRIYTWFPWINTFAGMILFFLVLFRAW